jgi:hypothetical protein
MASPAKSEAFAANLALIRRAEALASDCAKSLRMASERVTAPCSRRHRSICCNNCLGNSFGVTTPLRVLRRRGRLPGNTADFFMGYFTAITTSQPAPGRSIRSRVKELARSANRRGPELTQDPPNGAPPVTLPSATPPAGRGKPLQRDLPMSTFAEQVLGTATADRLACILFAAVLYLGYGKLRGQLDVVCAANGPSNNVYGAYPRSDPEHAKAICDAQRGE